MPYIGLHKGLRHLFQALCVALALPLAAGPASAAEWVVGGTVSQRLEAETDRDLSGNTGVVYGSSTRLGLGAARNSETSDFSVEAGISASVFGGPDDTGDLDRIDPSLTAEYGFRGRRIDVSALFDFGFQPASIAQVEDSGVTADDATQLTIKLGASVGYAISDADRVFVSADTNLVRFTSGATNLTETTNIGLDAGWEHRVNRRFAVNLGTGFSYFVSDNAARSRSLSGNLTAGASYRINPRLAFSSEAGVEMTRTRNTVNGLRRGETTVGLTANGSVDWRPTRNTSMNFAVSQSLEPSSLGELQTTTRFSFAGEHQINSRIGTDLGLAYQRQTSAGGFESNGTRRQLITLNSGVSFALTQDWSTRLGYTLRHELEDTTGTGGEGSSHLIFFEIIRDLAILP